MMCANYCRGRITVLAALVVGIGGALGSAAIGEPRITQPPAADAAVADEKLALAKAVADAIRADPVWKTPVRGNVTLAETGNELPGMRDRAGAGEIAIRWHSSNAAVLSDTDRRDRDDVIRKGVVRRGATDQQVRLTATITPPGSASIAVPLDLVVAARPDVQPENEAYLFVYFTGDSIEGEKLRFAVSDGNDALNWQEINRAQPMLQSEFGTRGVRDPFILRSAEGDRFFLLATDLSVGRTGWGGATDKGSSHLEIWESTDLIHWGNQRHVLVNTPRAGMTWAPEATYDPTLGAYVVYWTSALFNDDARRTGDGNGPQILMSTTRDFRTFTPPTPWFKSADLPELVRDKGMIDTTVLKDGETFYRFTKVTQKQGCPSPDIIGQRSTSLRAAGDSGRWSVIDRCIGRKAGTPEVEGPSAFVTNKGDISGYRYYLWVDNYGGVGYIPLATNSLEGPIRWTYPKKFRLPASPRHGSVLSITRNERKRLVDRWGVGPSSDRASPAQTVSAESVAATWVVPPVVASGIRLPTPVGTKVHWSADRPGLREDTLFNTGIQPSTVRLTGTLTLPGGASAVKNFTVHVLGGKAHRLFAYARTPTGTHDANQPVIARSVHFALGEDGRAPKPLNGNYGVLFPTGAYVSIDQVALHGIIDPSPFYFADGSLGIIATRINMATNKADQPNAALIFKADPARPETFVELGMVDLRATNGVHSPQAVWDTSAKRYVVSWKNRSGLSEWTAITDLARTERIKTPYFPANNGYRSQIVSAGNVGTPQAGDVTEVASPVSGDIRSYLTNAEKIESLPISALAATKLGNRYGRIANTTVTVDPQTVARGDIASVTAARATLSYSDDSTATRAVDWNKADIDRLRRGIRGTYKIRGTVRLPTYPDVFAYNRADPAIYRFERSGVTKYLFVATDDTDNNNVGSVHLPMRVADTIAELADDNGGRQREVDLLNRRTRKDRTVEGRVIAGCYWAPELHEIGGRLTILFAPCFNPDNDQSNENGIWSSVEAHLMQLRDGGDPANPADWSRPAAVRKADGSALGRPSFAKNISLDMSYFEVGQQSYYAWSQRYLTTSGPIGDPLTWIAKVDPSAPTRLTSEPKPIIAPNLSFEENLAEGAYALFRKGSVNLIYSSSGVSPTYVVGGVRADARSDLTNIDSWQKYMAPLQKSVPMPAGVTDYRQYQQGPGHGSFTTDPDGNTLYVYHSWGDGVGGNGRDTRVRRAHWSADDRPILDMTEEEEVALRNRSVEMVVTIH
jgi:GH43 family beta-xylosidase